jgi:FAD synthase
VELEIEVVEKLRDERKFTSPAELQAQITRDIAAVRERA